MLAMGRVLMLSPSVLVLDEPTANLAPLVATPIAREYIRGFADHGSTVLARRAARQAALRISDWTWPCSVVGVWSSPGAPRGS